MWDVVAIVDKEGVTGFTSVNIQGVIFVQAVHNCFSTAPVKPNQAEHFDMSGAGKT